MEALKLRGELLFETVPPKCERAFVEAVEAEIPSWACDELSRYNQKAGRKLGFGVDNPFVPFKVKHPVVLYRALGFDQLTGAAFLKKSKLVAKEGAKGVYKSSKVQSWTSDPSEAEPFAGLHSIAGREEGSLGIILKATVQPDDILIDVEHLPDSVKKNCLHFDQKEYLLAPVSMAVEIHKLLGPWPKDAASATKAGDLKKVLKAASERLKKKTDGASIGRTWNKMTGFSIEYERLKRRSPYDGRELTTAIEVSVEPSGVVHIEPFRFTFKGGKDYGFRLPTSSVSELVDYLASQRFDADYEATLDRAIARMKAEIRSTKESAERRGIPALLVNEATSHHGMRVKTHSAAVTQRTAKEISSKLRRIGYIPFIRPSEAQNGKFDVLVKI